MKLQLNKGKHTRTRKSHTYLAFVVIVRTVGPVIKRAETGPVSVPGTVGTSHGTVAPFHPFVEDTID